MNYIHCCDSLDLLRHTSDDSVDLVYIDPPFNTGSERRRGDLFYCDTFGDYETFLRARLIECYRTMKSSGSIFFHIDCRNSPLCRILLDQIFGEKSFMNEIIWSYDYGGRTKKRWPAKHDNILWYAKNPNDYTFNYDEIDRVPYLAPSLVGSEKAARGKTPTDVWFMTIVPTMGRENTGYPTQKPLKLLERIVKVHSNPGDVLMDFFAGSGSFGEAAAKHGRSFILADSNRQAYSIMESRLDPYL